VVATDDARRSHRDGALAQLRHHGSRERARIDREIAALFDEMGAAGEARRLPYVTPPRA
jgi:hypothetical protein